VTSGYFERQTDVDVANRGRVKVAARQSGHVTGLGFEPRRLYYPQIDTQTTLPLCKAAFD